MELLTEVPETGTKVQFDLDRPLEQPTGDSVMRARAQKPDGTQIFDAAYVECSQEQAKLLGLLLRELTDPSPTTHDTIAQEIQAMFSATLGGRDAAQLAELVTSQWWSAIKRLAGMTGTDHEMKHAVQKIAERFERASAQLAAPYATTTGNGQH